MKLAEKHKPFVVERFAQFKPLSIRTYAVDPFSRSLWFGVAQWIALSSGISPQFWRGSQFCGSLGGFKTLKSDRMSYMGKCPFSVICSLHITLGHSPYLFNFFWRRYWCIININYEWHKQRTLFVPSKIYEPSHKCRMRWVQATRRERQWNFISMCISVSDLT